MEREVLEFLAGLLDDFAQPAAVYSAAAQDAPAYANPAFHHLPTELRAASALRTAIATAAGGSAARVDIDCGAQLRTVKAGPADFGRERYALLVADLPPLHKLDERTADTEAPLSQSLWQAHLSGNFDLCYAPLVNLHDGAVCALDVRPRWRSGWPDWSMLRPADFPLAAALADWTLRRALRHLSEWRAAGLPLLPLALPLSALQLHDRRFPARVGELLATRGIDQALLGFEVADGIVAHDLLGAEAALARLRDAGLALTLYDDADGYAALTLLRQLDLDRLKLGPSLTHALPEDARATSLCKAVLTMAHHLGIEVDAAGVDREAQCDCLRQLMCDRAQGAWFGAPVAAGDINRLLGAAAAPRPLLPVAAPTRSLLLVDDEPGILSALRRLLRQDGYQILTANGGPAALELLRGQSVDVIISDQRMPGMLGSDFLRAARELHPDTVRIMLSGYTELQSVTDAVNEGAIYKFLTKPWDDELLRAQIAEAFRLKGIADENVRLTRELRAAIFELAALNRRMERLLAQKQQQIRADQVSLTVAHELLQFIPVPVIGLDEEGTIVFVNAAASRGLRGGTRLLGADAHELLPELYGDGPARYVQAADGGSLWARVQPMGTASSSRGCLVTFEPCGETV